MLKIEVREIREAVNYASKYGNCLKHDVMDHTRGIQFNKITRNELVGLLVQNTNKDIQN